MNQRLTQWALLMALAAAVAASAVLMASPAGVGAALHGKSCLQPGAPGFWPHAAGDALIGLASLLIAAGLLRGIGRRQGLPIEAPIVVLATVVLVGGLAHWLELWSAWQASVGLPCDARHLIASTSFLTAGALMQALPGWRHTPAVAGLTRRPPNPATPTDEETRLAPHARAWLEQRVHQRTAELQAATTIARAALVDAEQADRLKDTFLAMASHELRTPLQSTLYWAEMLRRQNTPELAAEAAQHIIHNVQVQSRLIDDLLDISRILTGQLRLEWRACDPVDVVEKAAEMVRAEAGVRGITLRLQRPAERVSMTADPVRLEQVAWNLMSNAVHASPDGAVVQVEMQADAQVFRLVVQDCGVGIEPSQIPLLFETFRQGTHTGHHGGLGLGLPITRSIVRQFDGQIEAFSPGPGQGACFTVELPLRGAASAGPQPPHPHPPPAPAHPNPLHGLRVLYVEHRTEAAHSAGLLLQSLGVQVEHCASFDAAARRIPLATFDVLLTSLQLDHGHSGEALVALLPQRGGPRPAAVSLSATGSRREAPAPAEAGREPPVFCAHVVMPVSVQDMGRVLLDAQASRPAP